MYAVLIFSGLIYCGFAKTEKDDNLYLFYLAQVVVLALQMLGLLGNPLVTLLYLLEQWDIICMGSSPRASDIRIVMSALTNAGLIFIALIANK